MFCLLRLLFCIGRGLCKGLINSPGESYRMSVSHYVLSSATVNLYTYNAAGRRGSTVEILLPPSKMSSSSSNARPKHVDLSCHVISLPVGDCVDPDMK
jgi:hypothetical protein